MTSYRRWFVLVLTAAMIGLMQRPASAQSLTLTWDPNPNPSVVGYVVYVGTSSGQYSAAFDVGNANWFIYNVVPEQPYFFAVASYAEGQLIGAPSAEVSGVAHASVVLSNPGNQTSVIGRPTTLALVGLDPLGQALTFTAQRLPPGLLLDSGSGLVSGTPTIAGTYPVTASASNGLSTDTQNFTWTTVTSAVDATSPVVTVTVTHTPQIQTSFAYTVLVGTVADDVGVNAVTWTNNGGETNTAMRADPWWYAVVLLQPGRNDITITAVDDAGNSGTATVSVYW